MRLRTLAVPGRLALASVLGAAALCAQTTETLVYRAVLLPTNEVPVVNIDAAGASNVFLHIMRDAQGRVVSASTTFDTTYRFPGAARITGMHIHRGRAGENGPVTIDSGIAAASAIPVDDTGRGTIVRQGFTGPMSTAGLETVNGILTDPSGFYVNVHTADFPGGAIRGQLKRAEVGVFLGVMSPANENPPITDLNASGTGSVVIIGTRDGNGLFDSAHVTFDINYSGFPEGTMFTGLHIHTGPAGVNGPVTVNSGMQGGANAVPAASGGAGNLHFESEVPVSNGPAQQTLLALFQNPGTQYINLHTTVNPGGAIRAQLRNTDSMRFSVNMSPANEVPPITGLEASALASFTAHTIRDAEGKVTAGAVVFDVSHRFPGETQFTGLHIHNGKAGENGPVTLDSGINSRSAIQSATGNGTIYRVATISSTAGLDALNSLVQNPENHYINLHTTVNPGGAVRAQLAPTRPQIPIVDAIISSVSDPALRTVAPGGLMTVFGQNFVKTPADIAASFNGQMLPSAFNGTQVTIAGRPAPLLMMTSTYLVAQVPFETPVGSQPVVVRNSNGPSANATVMVAAAAPGIYFDREGGLFTTLQFRRSGIAATPATRGEPLIVFSTGLGRARSSGEALATGQLVPTTGPNVLHFIDNVSVTVDGRPAQHMGTAATPGFAGLYQTAFIVPPETRLGSVPVQIRVGDAAPSNTVMLNVR